jgi:hypothetical protein
VLVSDGGRWLGEVEPFRVESPWWPDVEPVNLHLAATLGAQTFVLRLLAATGTPPRDGAVVYHAEVAHAWRPVDAGLAAAAGEPQPLRRAWARQGGPAEDLAWMADALANAGRPVVGPAVQVKTWNLSCVFRLPTGRGPVWLKTTGPEQTREELPIAAVARHDPALVPEVVAADPAHGRVLCTQLAGRHLPDAGKDAVLAVTERWVAAQAALAAEVADLIAAGMPHWPLSGLADHTRRLLAAPPTAALSAPERRSAERLVDRVPAIATELEAAGLPETLVHGDFTPVNWHGDDDSVAIMDWSDSYVGHPAHDIVALLGWLPVEWHDDVIAQWCRAWQRHRPGSRPEAAVDHARPLVHLHMANVYARFLAAIEPAERCYHEDDPPAQLRLALATVESP